MGSEYVLGAKKLVGRHIGASDLAQCVIRIAEKLPEVTKIVVCPKNIHAGSGPARVGFESQVGGIMVKTSQSRTHQSLRLITNDPQKVRSAITEAVLRKGYRIVNR